MAEDEYTEGPAETPVPLLTIYALEESGRYIYVGATARRKMREREQGRIFAGREVTFHVLEEDPPDGLQAAERRWIAYGQAEGWPLENRSAGGEPSRLGVVESAETRAKKRASHLGLRSSAEHRASQSAALVGRVPGFGGHKHSAEARAKISAGNKGKTVSAETRAKISEARRRQETDRG